MLIVRHALHDVILAAIATNKIGIILFIGFRFLGWFYSGLPKILIFGKSESMTKDHMSDAVTNRSESWLARNTNKSLFIAHIVLVNKIGYLFLAKWRHKDTSF